MSMGTHHSNLLLVASLVSTLAICVLPAAPAISAPPAAVDQYRPGPPPPPGDSTTDQPANGAGTEPVGPGSEPGRSVIPPTPTGDSQGTDRGDPSGKPNVAGDPNESLRRAERAADGSGPNTSERASGPEVAGYPLTSGVLAAVVALLLALVAA